MEIKWLYIACMAYMSVSGGPFGIEEVLHNMPLYESLAIVILASVTHMLPSGIMTYEMIQIYDKDESNGGTIGWVNEALGDKIGMVNAVFNIVDTAFDNAIYPVIIRDNLQTKGYIIPIAVVVTCTMLNWKNTEFTGKVTLLQTLVILSPFIYLVLTTPINSEMYVDTRGYDKKNTWNNAQEALMIVVWNVSGFDMCASYIHTLLPTSKDIRDGFIVAFFLTLFSYLFVICCGSYYLHEKNDWVDGSWPLVADMKFGEAGRTWVQIASLVSCVATLCVELCSTSHLWTGMVKLNALPNIFQNIKFNLVVNLFITIGLSTALNFEDLVDISALLNVSTVMLESVAWVRTLGFGKFYWRLVLAACIMGVNVAVSARCLLHYNPKVPTVPESER